MNDDLHYIEFTRNLIVTNDNIDDIMCAALEGGITYWCGKAEVVGDYLGEYASEQISRGGTLNLYDIEDGSVYELTLFKFLQGVRVYMENSDDPPIMYNNRIDTSEIDADAADSIIQYALFGDIVYG